MKINITDKNLDNSGTLVVFALEGEKEANLIQAAEEIDKSTNGALKKAASIGTFKGKFGQVVDLLAPGGVEASRILLVGLGKEYDLSDNQAEQIGGKIINKLLYDGDKVVNVAAGDHAAHMAFGVLLRQYRFHKYYTTEKNVKKPTVEQVNMMASDKKKAQAEYETLEKIADGIFWARDLVSEPGNVIYPESYAEQIKDLSKLGVDVEILNEAAMAKLGMDSLLGVGQGSANESLMVIMKWMGSKNADEAPVALVGKGVTFDTGGISLKPGAGMEDMKFDMGGSAAVVGAMKALAGRNAKVNAIGVVGLVENMPSSTAQRPGDVVTSMSGQTIEVINTDAEGRLVLADCLWYTQDKYKPKFMIDLATLTGAMMIALGQERAGIFSNDDDLCDQLLEAGDAVDELVWRMPISDGYDKLINSDIADMKNIGGRYAGSITAAQFLQRFVNDVPWVHIDIAGTAWRQKPSDVAEKGATGYGVRLLDRLIRDNYED